MVTPRVFPLYCSNIWQGNVDFISFVDDRITLQCQFVLFLLAVKLSVVLCYIDCSPNCPGAKCLENCLRAKLSLVQNC